VILPVVSTFRADGQIRDVHDWWRSNRPASPTLFADELAIAFTIIANAPNIGRLYRRSPVPGTRRILLKGTRYHVYYVPLADEVRVLAVWHARRGVGPPLRAEK
jgi:plasmid stabilization system protein ParE